MILSKTPMDQNEDKKEYELSFLLRNEEGIAALQGMLTKFGCVPTSQSEIKRIVLAYPIKKETSALFGYVYFMATPEHMKEFTHELRLESHVLRFLLINKPIKREFVSASEGSPRRGAPEVSEKEGVSEEKPSHAVTNEDLEKKLEEILN